MKSTIADHNSYYAGLIGQIAADIANCKSVLEKNQGILDKRTAFLDAVDASLSVLEMPTATEEFVSLCEAYDIPADDRLLLDSESRPQLAAVRNILLLPKYQFAFTANRKQKVHKAFVFYPRPSDLETRDIGAIVPSLNRAATFQRRCGVIGSHEATDEHGETFTRTFVDPLAYLRSGRRGVLIVDPKQASAFLAGKRTIPSDDGVVEKENAD